MTDGHFHPLFDRLVDVSLIDGITYHKHVVYADAE